MVPYFTGPRKEYAGSFAEALREGLHIHETKEAEIRRIETDFAGWLEERDDLSVPVALPDGRIVPRVPQTTRWLVGSGRFIGVVNIRHNLSESLKTYGGHIGYAVRASERRKGYGRKLLEEGLKVAANIGLTQVLLTCNENNIASLKLIEGAGGVMKDAVTLPDRKVLHRLYWIDI